ncbi:MAG: hypothetical protein KBS40_02125 [Bacteroidales bacterium]|nr:hypothetical protein [Bacteroidales bacterium]
MTPDGSGDYFGWGEVQPRSYYGWGDYKYSDYDVKMTKYCTNSSYGKVDNKTILELTDDAAYVNWAGNWRMPTYEEFDELKNNCTWTWTTQDGIKGYKVTGKNGNSIFLPSVGYQDNHGLCDAGYNGYYWSSSLVLDNGENRDAYGFYFDYLGTVDWCLQYYGSIGKSRYCGLSVRPVCP